MIESDVEWIRKPVRLTQLVRALSGPALRESRDAASTLAALTIPCGSNGRRARVLVAEDNPINQDVAREMLELMSCDVVIVPDGRGCVAAYEQNSFDLVLMDCQMPEMDGFEAARELRRLEVAAQRPPVPIIALTANALTGDRERCLSVGMDDFLSKPFQREALQKLVERWTGARLVAALDSSEPLRRTGEPDRSASCLSRDALDALLKLRRPDRPDIVSRVIHSFLSESGKQFVKLAGKIRSGERAEVAKIAHMLKSGSASVGALQLSQLLADLEASARDSEIELNSLQDRITAEFARVSSALERFLDESAVEISRA
jgi:CheY-like chemotaxis protein/HPt (histidine-containing phosphotransfer) domain-containing protein